jgi:type IV secretion system protein TrbL
MGGLRMAAGGSVGALRSAASLAGASPSSAGSAAAAARSGSQPQNDGTPSGDSFASTGGKRSGLASHFRRGQQVKDAARVVGQTLKEGDKGSQSSGPKLRED